MLRAVLLFANAFTTALFNRLLLAVALLTPAIASATAERAEPPVATKDAAAAFANIAIPFVANAGQHDARVAFSAGTLAEQVFVTRDGKLVYSLPAGEAEGKAAGWTLTETFVAGRAKPAGGTQSPTRVSRFVGDDPSAWQQDIATYQDVTLGEVWEGIDVRLNARGRNIEKIYTVAPGARASAIRMKVGGAQRLKLAEDGGLIAETGLGPVSFSAPVAYQEIAGEQHAVKVSYAVSGGGDYRFKVGDYDRSRPLVIDPILQSTYLGGPTQGSEHIRDIAIHPTTGDVYVVGTVDVKDFPGTSGGAQPNSGDVSSSFDAVVARLNPQLTSLLQATYYGGTGGDVGIAIALTATDVYIAGTGSFTLPQTGGAPVTSGGGGFVARFPSSLTSITQATFVDGGGANSFVRDLLIHPNGDIYVTGRRDAGDPVLRNTTGAYQPTHRGGQQFDAFVVRFNSALTAIVRSTYLGGTGNDDGRLLDMDTTTGHIYVAGNVTGTADFPGTAGGAQSTAVLNTGSGRAGFVSRLTADLSSLAQSTYVQGRGSNVNIGSGDGLLVHPINRDVYIAGDATADLLGISGSSFQAANAGTGLDAPFVARLNPGLTTFVITTYFGTDRDEVRSSSNYNSDRTTHALAAHPVTGDIYLNGFTGSSLPLIGVAGGAQSTNAGNGDAFVARFNAGLTQLFQSTYFGGSQLDEAYSTAIHPTTGDVYLAGRTGSANLPVTAGGYQAAKPGNTAVFSYDGFITRISADMAAVAPAGTIQFSAATYSVGESGNAAITVTRTGGSSGAISATFNTSNGTATSGSDYTATTGVTVTFANGDIASKTVNVPILTDTVDEPNETVNLALTGSSVGAQGRTAVLTITDDDPAQTGAGSLQFSAATFTIGEAGPQAAITVTRIGGSTGAVSVVFRTSNGSAIAGQDYTAVNRTVSFANGDSAAKTVSVPIINNALVESSETVNLTLTNPASGATLGAPASATLTITDND